MTDSLTRSDDSITTFSQDNLGREEFSRRIADRIRMAGTGPSVVFGLAGAWGAGKTSVLNMIQLSLADAPEWTVVEFTPWAATDLDALTSEFYEAIASAMPSKGKKGKTARALLMSAVPVATSVAKVAVSNLIDHKLGAGTVKKLGDAAAAATLDEVENHASEQPAPAPFRSQFAKMSEAIERTGAKVLVIVDDLDRLHSDELLVVMKAVRLLGRFPGVHYLLSYDRRTVLDLIKASDLAGADSDRARAYLEKIVQYPFELPPLQPAHSRREVTEQITRIATRFGCSLTGTDARTGRTWNAVDELVTLLTFLDNTTLRTIYRWCAQVDMLLTLLGPGHIDLLDAALITYLRLHHEQVYDRLPGWRAKLVGSSSDHIVLPGSQRETAEDWMTRIQNETTDIKESDLTEAYRILVYLFPRLPRRAFTRVRPPNTTPQVHQDEFFDRYFTFSLPESDISEVTAAAEISSLVDMGVLPAGVLQAFLNAGNDRQRLALRKIARELERVIDNISTPQLAATIIVSLWPSLVNEHGQMSFFSSGFDIAAMLIGQAVNTSFTPADTRAAVNKVRQEIGLFEIATVLVEFRRGRDEYPVEISAAIVDIRREVLDVCMTDLTSPHAPSKKRLLSFLYFLTADMYSELRQRIDDAGLTQLEVAARVIAEDSNIREGLDGSFYREPFESIYPYDEWNLNEFPDPPSVDHLPDRQDSSVEARRIRATYAIHSIMAVAPNMEPG